MTKPWEETWEAQRYVVEMAGDAGRRLGQFVDDNDDPDNPSCDRDRAELAAAAPDLARALLAIEWHHAKCRICMGHEHRGGHEDHCIVDIALRKAGVR